MFPLSWNKKNADGFSPLLWKEEKLKKDQLDGIDSYAAGTADLNFMFDRHMSTKSELRVSTRLTLEQQREFLSYLDEMPEYNKWKP